MPINHSSAVWQVAQNVTVSSNKFWCHNATFRENCVLQNFSRNTGIQFAKRGNVIELLNSPNLFVGGRLVSALVLPQAGVAEKRDATAEYFMFHISQWNETMVWLKGAPRWNRGTMESSLFGKSLTSVCFSAFKTEFAGVVTMFRETRFCAQNWLNNVKL